MASNKVIVEFQVIDTENPKFLMVGDLSNWATAENKTAYIQITLPGSRKFKTFIFRKHHTSTFNSHNLGISCLTNNCNDQDYVELPDGMYKICVKSGIEGIEESKYYLKTDKLEQDLGKIIIKNGLEYSRDDEDFIEKAFKIKWKLWTAKENTKFGHHLKGSRDYEEAKSMLSQLTCE